MPVARILILLVECLLVGVSVLAAAPLASRVRLIPRALLHLPQIDFSFADTRVVALALMAGAALSLLALRLLAGWDIFGSPRRAAAELYALLVGIVTATLGLFLLTAISFSPELLLQSTLISFALFGLLYAGVAGWQSRRFATAFTQLMTASLRLLRSPLQVGKRESSRRNELEPTAKLAQPGCSMVGANSCTCHLRALTVQSGDRALDRGMLQPRTLLLPQTPLHRRSDPKPQLPQSGQAKPNCQFVDTE